MLAASEVDYLIEATRSCVKRFGGPGPTFAHLAYVLSDKWKKQFAEVFGDDGSGSVLLLLNRSQFVGNESDVRELLAGSPDEKAVLAELHRRLLDQIQSVAMAATAEQQGVELTRPKASVDPTPSADPGNEWPQRTRRFVELVPSRIDLIERDASIAQLASILGRTRRRIPVITGLPGSGRTALLGGLATAMTSNVNPVPVYRVDPDTLVADTGSLVRIFEDCESPAVLVIDDIDRIAALDSAHPEFGVLRALSSVLSHPHARSVLVCNSRYYRRFEMHAESLVDKLVQVRVDALTPQALEVVLDRAVKTIEDHHGVSISVGLRRLALQPARPNERTAHPGLAIDRVDAAASRCRVLGDTRADVEHLAGFATDDVTSSDTKDLCSRLGARVLGQPTAIQAVAARLALTLARLDLRPERPDGVFLFVGPTGVGKTELARGIAAALFGSEDRLIRLDMSEYAHDWAVSRLVGPMPGFVGSTEPETWLTTRVAQMPECVVLLDEIEKAHPTVWNTFLQVFDAGRLTDSRGTTADFSSTVIVMTSNLGASAAGAPALGFGSQSGDRDRARERITRTVREAMAPELLNRVDELIVFDALSMAAITDIAAVELARVQERLAELGWIVRYNRDVVEHLASSGYDPAYGARHLHRNIERVFLSLLARSDSRSVVVTASDGELEVSPACE
ncbi:AAA family ATPase [Mycobacterium sp. M26]|uniref:AAA family ATPase n=1 Tax=Mycobacterium sp. M26 TaxID=1762962 RepID=UPI0009EC9B0D|nr:AAA family ATPase [Mycobacterium sp. M26]